MDSLDNMFVPYKDVLYPSSSTTVKKSFFSKNIFWFLGICILGCFFGYLYFSKHKSTFPNLLQESLPILTTNNFIKPITSTVPTIKEIPTLKEIPKTISLIRGGQKEIYASSTELARHVGTAVKETLLTFPQMNAPLVTNIVQCAVKSVLGSQKEKETPKEIIPVKKEVVIKKEEPPVMVPKEGILSLRNLPIPFNDDEEELSNDSGKKQGKINAESNPYVIQMMKERGLDKKSND